MGESNILNSYLFLFQIYIQKMFSILLKTYSTKKINISLEDEIIESQ